MTTPTTGTGTSVLDRTEIDPSTGEPRMAHLVPPKGGKEGHVRIMEARIEGTMLTALCGHQFIPMRDPQAFPNCQRCIEVFKANTGEEEGFQDG